MAETNEAKATKKRGPLDPNSPAGIRNAWAKAEREYHEQAKRADEAMVRLRKENDALARCDTARREAAKRMTDSLARALGAPEAEPPEL